MRAFWKGFFGGLPSHKRVAWLGALALPLIIAVFGKGGHPLFLLALVFVGLAETGWGIEILPRHMVTLAGWGTSRALAVRPHRAGAGSDQRAGTAGTALVRWGDRGWRAPACLRNGSRRVRQSSLVRQSHLATARSSSRSHRTPRDPLVPVSSLCYLPSKGAKGRASNTARSAVI